MKCELARILINEYIDGRLDEEGKSELVSHIENCHACASELKKYEYLKKLLKNMPDAEPPSGLLAGAVKQARREQKEERRPSVVKRAVALAAAVVITLGVGWYVYSSNVSNSPMNDAAAPQARNELMMEKPAVPMEGAADMQEFSARGIEESGAALEAAPEASAPAASEAPAASAETAAKGMDSPENNAGLAVPRTAGRMVIVVYTVPAEAEASFSEELKVFSAEYGLVAERANGKTDADKDSVTYVVSEKMKDDFVILLEKYGLMDKELPEFPFKATFQFSKS